MKLDKVKFKLRYFIGFLAILTIEVAIAVFIKTGFVRHTFGDILAVILVYCFLRSIINISLMHAAVFSLCIAFMIEFTQRINLLKALGLGDNALAKIVLGNTFEPMDLIAYTIGFLVIIMIETLKPKL